MLSERWNLLSERRKLELRLGAAAGLALTLWFVQVFATTLPAASAAHSRAAVAIRGTDAKGAPSALSEKQASLVGGPQQFEQVSPQQAQLINAKIPISTLPNPSAEPFVLPTDDSADRMSAVTCLTMAVYYEAASQSDQGEAAVAQVVLNRLRNPLFPKTVCGVVFQGSTLPTGCQFTFTCDGSLGRRPSKAGWERARRIAERALDGYVEKSVGDATHYHTVWVVPYWQSTVIKVAQVGAHIFYRWAGPLGMPGAFRGQYAGSEVPSPLVTGFDGDVNGGPITTASGAPSTAVQPIVAETAKPIAPMADAPTQLAQFCRRCQRQSAVSDPLLQLVKQGSETRRGATSGWKAAPASPAPTR
jgi:spore germination cell wall hydrolase CwlJ-like protein